MIRSVPLSCALKASGPTVGDPEEHVIESEQPEKRRARVRRSTVRQRLADFPVSGFRRTEPCVEVSTDNHDVVAPQQLDE